MLTSLRCSSLQWKQRPATLSQDAAPPEEECINLFIKENNRRSELYVHEDADIFLDSLAASSPDEASLNQTCRNEEEQPAEVDTRLRNGNLLA